MPDSHLGLKQVLLDQCLVKFLFLPGTPYVRAEGPQTYKSGCEGRAGNSSPRLELEHFFESSYFIENESDIHMLFHNISVGYILNIR